LALQSNIDSRAVGVAECTFTVIWLRNNNGLRQYKNKHIIEESNMKIEVTCPLALIN
jgi:hypothetical protein